MPPAAALYLRTFVIGVAVAAPVGAMGVLCIQRTLQRGWRAGLATGFGIATADGLYAGLAAFGVAALSAMLVTWQTPLRVVGGAALVYLGMRSILAKPAAAGVPVKPDPSAGVEPSVDVDEYDRTYVALHPRIPPRDLAFLYSSAVGLTLTNPLTIMAFAAVFASAALAAPGCATSPALANTGVASGSLWWWVVLVVAVRAAHGRLGDRLAAQVARVSGVVIVAFGAVAVFLAVWPLVR